MRWFGRTPASRSQSKQVVESLGLVVASTPSSLRDKIIQRICEPERQIIFRVPWQGRLGRGAHQLGFLAEFNSVLGLFK